MPRKTIKFKNQKHLIRKQMIAETKRWLYNLCLELDVRPLFQTAFQELLIICMLGTVGAVVDHSYISGPNDKKDVGCTTLLCQSKFPLAFFGITAVVTLFESRILPQIVGSEYIKSSSFHRILQKLIILATLLLLNWAPAVIYTPQKSNSFSIGDALKNKYALGPLSIVVLTAWMGLATKLLGTLAVVTFTRLYVDVGNSAYELLTYIPPNNEYSEMKKNSSTELDKLNNNAAFERTSGERR